VCAAIGIADGEEAAGWNEKAPTLFTRISRRRNGRRLVDGPAVAVGCGQVNQHCSTVKRSASWVSFVARSQFAATTWHLSWAAPWRLPERVWISIRVLRANRVRTSDPHTEQPIARGSGAIAPD